MCQLAGVDIAHFGVAGDIPITVIAWAAPKIGNAALAARVQELHPRLRILRIKNLIDSVANCESMVGEGERVYNHITYLYSLVDPVIWPFPTGVSNRCTWFTGWGWGGGGPC